MYETNPYALRAFHNYAFGSPYLFAATGLSRSLFCYIEAFNLALVSSMPPSVSEYSYDVFVSYRHKDNVYDQWVTTFVDHLRMELAATFKEDISVYFDQNASDGLHAFHDVDASLRDKVRAKIFVPILSRTYCDPKSFAWQHEFLAFRDFANSDNVGLMVSAGSGNKASRILAIRIHDLDPEDVALFEQETGTKLRPIDFIYQSAGVDRPLRVSEERPEANQKKTIYRDQINQVAMAARSLLAGMQKAQTGTPPDPPTTSTEIRTSPKKWKALAAGILGIVAVLIVMYLWKGNGNGLVTVPAAASIAVLPFTNLAGDDTQEYFSDGITEQIITELAQIKNLKVIARTSVMKFKRTTKTIQEIGQELGVTHILEGSVRRDGARIRITAQLIDVADQSHLWAKDFDEAFGEILRVQDEVSMRIAGTLKQHLTPEDRLSFSSQTMKHPEAYDHFLKGQHLHRDLYFTTQNEMYFEQSRDALTSAIALEPGFAPAVAELGSLYDSQMNFLSDTTRVAVGRRDSLAVLAYRLDPRLWSSLLLKAFSFYHYPDVAKDQSDSVYHYLTLAYQSAPNNSVVCEQVAIFLQRRSLWYDCMPFLEKAIKLDPLGTIATAWLGYANLQFGNMEAAAQNFQRVISTNPDALDGYVGMGLTMALAGRLPEAESMQKKAELINKDSPFVTLLEATILAYRGDKRAEEIFPHQYILIFLGKFDKALKIVSDYPDQYEFYRDSPFYEPLRNLKEYRKVMDALRPQYDINRHRYRFEL